MPSPCAYATRDGCAHCANDELPHLNGTAGRTVVAEMIEPSHDDTFLRCVRQRDNLALRRHLRGRRAAPFDSPDMNGKSAMECAVYKASIGEIDPRDVESRFQSYASVERERSAAGAIMPDWRAMIARVGAARPDFQDSLRLRCDALRFSGMRADYYEYLADMLDGLQGRKTLRDLLR